MNRYIILVFLLILLLLTQCKTAIEETRNTIIIELEIPAEKTNDVNIQHINRIAYTRILDVNTPQEKFYSDNSSENPKLKKWIIKTNDSISIYSHFAVLPFLYPGDSVHIKLLNGSPVYSGEGSNKNTLWYLVQSETSDVVQSLNPIYEILTIDDYITQNNLLNKQFQIQSNHFSKLTDKIADFELNYLKELIFSTIEIKRITAFNFLLNTLQKNQAGKLFIPFMLTRIPAMLTHP